MAWGMKDIGEQRVRFVVAVSRREKPLAQLCREFEISRPTGYVWIKRYCEQGIAGLEEHSRRPRHSPRQTAEALEQWVIQMRSRWPDWGARKIGKKLEGKIHIYCGSGDNFFLNNAVYLVEDILKNTKDPYYGGEVDYGDRAEHCWNGDHSRPNAISRLRYHQLHAPKIVERIRKSAPVGADTTSWRY